MFEINSRIGNLSRPQGSVLYSEGDSTVTAGIYGPLEVKSNKMLIDRGYLEAHYRPKCGLPGVEDRLRESIIRSICDVVIAVNFYPRSSLVVVVQEMQSDRQLISCAINAICLAILDSGIDMKSMFGAVNCFLTNDGLLKLNSKLSDNEIKATFVFVFDSIDKKVITSHTVGMFTLDQYREAINLCRNQVDNVFNYFKQQIK